MIKNRTQNVVKNTVIHFTRKHFNRYRQFFKARAMNSVAAVILQLFLSTLIIDGEIIDSSTVVEIEQGKLAGTVLTSRNGDRFYAFHSIPYAKPPIGSLRFKPPQQPEKWSGLRNITTTSPACIQVNYFTHEKHISGQEDCLYLNVFTKQLNGNVPVLVFIHGGGYMAGTSSLYPPTYIMDCHPDVVLVTINYRLGILGYLSTGDNELPGNNGMKDQVAALKWVQKNIAAFGGDAANVLIFGQSAGGASVHLHLFSPLSKGLFNKAFSFSGSALNVWAVSPPEIAKQYFLTTSLITGCSFENTTDAVRCLKDVPAEDLVKTQMKLLVRGIHPACTFTPIIEAATVPEPFLTEIPQHGHEVNPQIPWIVGQTSAEGILFVHDYMNNDGLKYLNDNYRRLLLVSTMTKPWLRSEFESTEYFAEQLKKIYLDVEDIDVKTVEKLVNLYSDMIFTFGIAKSAIGYKGRAYLYHVDYKRRSGPKSLYDDRLTSLGVYHGEELDYYFNVGNLLRNEKDIDSQDYEVSGKLLKMLSTFAYTGNPNINETINFTWNPVNGDLSRYLFIDNSGRFKSGSGFFERKYDIWNYLSKYVQR